MLNNTIEHNGYKFAVRIEFDDACREPWKEHDGHGIVSEWTTRGKAPGELVLNQDRRSFRYYDFQGTLAIARRDGWGPAKPVPGETAKQRAARAVREDFERLRGWCNDQWHWCGVVVELLDRDGCPTGEMDSLWGIESDAGDYLDEVATECAAQILAQYDAR